VGALEPPFKKRPIGYLYRNYSCSFRTSLRARRAEARATVAEIESAERTRKKSKSTRWIECKWGGETTVNIEQTGQASEW
jgi:hypothetical protein